MVEIVHKALSDRLIGAAFRVHCALGPGLLERVYESALCVELEFRGISFARQKAYPVLYCERLVGEYFADLVIDDSIIVEIKSTASLTPLMESQLIHYLRISGIAVGYLINFNSCSLIWKRLVTGRDS